MHSNDTSKRTVDYTLFRRKEKVGDRDKRKGSQQTAKDAPEFIRVWQGWGFRYNNERR